MAPEPSINFILSQASGTPMYQQIMEQIKNLVAIGDWPPGQQLPSIREMAVATKVSVITVKRAYQELESEGVIVTQHGKGSFIAKVDNLSQALKKQELDQHLTDAITVAHSLGMSPQELQQTLQKRLTQMVNPGTTDTDDDLSERNDD